MATAFQWRSLIPGGNLKQQWSSLIVVVLAVVAIVLLVSSTAMAVSTTVVIGEFRTRGPNGGNDEFVEIYNLSALPVGISGWKLNGSNNAGTIVTRATVPASTMLSPYQHYLFTNSSITGGPYNGPTLGNQTYGTGIIALASVSMMAVIALRRRNRAA